MLRLVRRALLGPALAVPLLAQAHVADTQFSAGRGLYDQPFDVAITTATPGATIRCTLDCSDPRVSSAFVEGPSPLIVRVDPASANGGLRPLTPAVVLRAYAYAPGLLPTNVDTQTYVFAARVPAQTRPAGFPATVAFDMDQAVLAQPVYGGRILSDLAAIPTVSVVAPHAQVFGPGGLLDAWNSSIEVPGSIEVVHPDGRTDQADCGLVPHSWIQAKRSIRVYFRAQYGDDKWRHDLFRDAAEGHAVGVTSFDGLVLRAGFNDGILFHEPARAGRYSFAVDELGRSSQIAATGFGPRGMFAHLYLNGLYWGLYNPIERPESSFWADVFGGGKDDYFARNHGGPIDGDPTWFDGLIAGATNWGTVQARLDVPSFCDYILYWTYCGGGDWPSTASGNNNWYAGNRNLPAPGKVRFFVWDCEDSWIDLPFRPGAPLDGARLCTDLLNGAFDISRLWRGVQAVADFRLQFADRVYRQCANDGPLSEAATLRRWNRITRRVDRGVVGESARWGRFDPRGVTWTRNADWLPYTDAVRAMFTGNEAQLVAALRNTLVPSPHPLLYPNLDPPLFRAGAAAIPVTEAWVAAGATIDVVRAGPLGTIYYTIDGSDPRAPGGAPAGIAGGAAVAVPVPGSLLLRARTHYLGEWSALHELRLHVRAALPAVEIHEVLAENEDGLDDEAGDRDDWIELRNRGVGAVDLSGFHLTDDLARPTKWTFPAGTVLPPGGLLLVWADDEPAEGPLHASFRLSAQGETVGLFAPGGAVAVDQLAFGPQTADESIGRLDADPARAVTFLEPSPQRSNRPNPCGHVAIQALDPAANPLRLVGKGVPSVGDSLRYELEDVPTGTVALLALGLATQHLPTPGLGTLLVDPALVLVVPAGTGGEARFSFALPDADYLRGVVVFAQGAASTAGTLQLSNAVYSQVCR